ncbi:glycosyltransferase [Myxococcota bacterium]|nr:glycosyltransferase [Myxococcota bacterium]
MRVVAFHHSLVSDWNHGNAHFLRGISSELVARGHEVTVWEPEGGWSRTNLLRDQGARPLDRFAVVYPDLTSRTYTLDRLELDRALDGADLVLVHEWNDHELVARIGRHRARGGRYTLLFHDTHHRAVTDPSAMSAYDLSAYDGVLAFGEVLRELYAARGWARRAFTWHEAADTRVFRSIAYASRTHDLVWIGNWGDEERTEELTEYLLEPARALSLDAHVYGVRYPAQAIEALAAAGIEHRGWVANFDVPRVFAAHAVTIHVPRRPYVRTLPGIPTIRVFEALACGIPLVSAPWSDVEGLFTPGRDYLVARDGAEMRSLLRAVLSDPGLARSLASHGLATIRARHTCAHRVDELLAIVAGLGGSTHVKGALDAGGGSQWQV